MELIHEIICYIPLVIFLIIEIVSTSLNILQTIPDVQMWAVVQKNTLELVVEAQVFYLKNSRLTRRLLSGNRGGEALVGRRGVHTPVKND